MIPYTRHLYLDGVLVYPVLGPLSGTGVDNELVRWNGTDYHHIQSCPGVGVDDSGQMYIGSGASSPCSRLEIWDDSAHPILSITAAHATDYDPQVQYRTDVTDTVKCSMGIDASDDSLRINMGVGVGGATHFVMDTNGGVKWQNSTDSTTSYQWFDADGGTPIMNIDTTNERVGIGTTAPGAKLDIIGDAGLQLRLSTTHADNTNKYAYLTTKSYDSDEEDFSLFFGGSRNDALGNFVYYGGGSGTANAATKLGFFTAESQNDLTGTERMTINNLGNVGIGETAPSYKLEVNGTTHSTGNFTTDARIGVGITPSYPLHITNSSDNIILAYLIGTSTTPASSAILDLRQQSAADSTAMCRFRNDADYWSFGISGDDSFIISDSFADTLSSPRLVILQSGNIGIGETAPSYKLEVNGTIHSTGNFTTDARIGIGITPGYPLHITNSSDNIILAYLIGTSTTPASSAILDLRQQSAADSTAMCRFRNDADYWSFGISGDDSFIISDSFADTLSSPRLVILQNGNVGIGTATPGAKLDIIGDAGLQLRLSTTHADNTNKYAYLTTKSYDSDEEDFSLFFGGSRNDALGNFVYYGGGSGTANAATKLGFFTAESQNDLTGTERMTINNLGNVGIGETAPETHLEMTGTAPYMTFHCDTETDAADSGMCKILFKREQLNGTESTHAAIYAAHDGSDANQKGYIAFCTNATADGNSPTERMRIDSSGNVGIGVTDPDAKVEIFSTSTQLKLSYDTTNYCTIATGANGDTTITTVDAGGADGDIVFNPDGYVGVGETSPDGQLHQTIASASDIGHIIELAASQTGNAFEVNTNGATGGDLIKFTSGGKIQTTAGFRAVSKEFSDAFVSWKYGGDTAEHSGQTGSYDHTGGTYERLFTATAAVFSQDDEDNHTWIVINSGTYKGAKAEIETYIDTTNVVVRGMGWDGDISSSTFSIVPHPLFIAGDGCNLAGCIGNQGNLHVRSKGFIGVADTDIMMEFIGDFGADDKTCFCIDVDANGYNHSDALCIGYKTGDLQPGDFAHGIHVSVDDTEATSADSTTEIDCLTFETANASSIEQHAIHVGVGFDIALLVSGAAAVDPDYGYEVASGSVVDRVNSGGAGDDAFVNSGTNQQILDADNDYILIGDDDTFEVLQVILATPGNQPAELEFYYSKAGGNWTQFYPSDGTNGFTRSGLISISAPGDWTEDDEAEANGDITEGYYWKIKRTRNNLVTPPTESYFKIFSSIDAGMQIRGDGTIKPASLADASAANDSIYYSTTQSKLVYKDSGGSVNDLY